MTHVTDADVRFARGRVLDAATAPQELTTHPGVAGMLALRRSIVTETYRAIRDRMDASGFAHVHLPVAQWRQLLGVIAASPADGMWVQMYSYLDDARFELLRRHQRSEVDRTIG